jgi:hypothetical protein
MNTRNHDDTYRKLTRREVLALGAAIIVSLVRAPAA